MKNVKKLGVALLLAGAFGVASGHDAHVHGIGKLDIALEDVRLTIDLDTPLANLIGFEHAPRTAAQRQAVEKMEKLLRTPHAIFTLTPEAGCKPVEVDLASPVLAHQEHDQKKADEHHESHHDEHAHDHGHADLEGTYRYVCARPEKLREIDVNLFRVFKGFHQVDVQLVTPHKQSAQKLTPDHARIRW